MSHKTEDVPLVRSVESNAVANLLFEPSLDLIESMTSEVYHPERCDGASLDAAATVLMKLVLEVDAPLGDPNYINPICFTPTSSVSEHSNGKIKTRID